MSSPSLTRLFLSFLRLGLTAFGGPAMIAYIKELSVKKNKWLDEERFKDGMVLCQSIPGATVMQMAGYVGLRVKGISGALASYVGFGLPAFLLMLIFAFLYANYHDLSYFRIILLSASFLGIGASPFLVILGAGLFSVFLFPAKEISEFSSAQRDGKGNIKQIIFLLITILAGITALYLIRFDYFILSALMMKIDLFAFGGGFTPLPLMLHEIVELRGWIDEKTFMNGIALGQVTPGPIVITATFVGWDIIRILLGVVALIALIKKIDLLYVVTIGGIVSILLFS